MFSVTVTGAETEQPPDKVAVTTYCPPALTTGFCDAEVYPLGPVQEYAVAVLVVVANSCAVLLQVTVPVTEVLIFVLEPVPVSLTLSK